MSAAPKWLTATPLVYGENLQFWDRDAGLLCLGLRQLGQDSRFVALGKTTSVSTTQPLITGRIEDFHDPAWWRQWGATGVILNAWGTPRYEPVARAIKAAGLRLVVRLDSDGCKSPRMNTRRYYQLMRLNFGDRGRAWPRLAALVKTALHLVSRAAHDDGMCAHLGHADLITIESPLAQAWFSELLFRLGRVDLVDRLRVLPHPVVEDFRESVEVVKRPVILAAGRWESPFKDTPKLIRVLGAVLGRQPDARALVIGPGEPVVRRELARLPAGEQARIEFTGPQPHAELARHMQGAQLIFCSSHLESFHLVSAEGLCCGCSVVGPAAIPSMHWFTAEQSGTLASDRSDEALMAALETELAEWRSGRRDAGRISATWCARVHATAVAAEAMRLVGELPTSTR
jgi:glycosyltransferase involved in cell wall biosynthesis